MTTSLKKITIITTEQIVLASRPKGLPVSDNFRMNKVVLPEITACEILLKDMYYSVDPYMRGRMNDAKSYTVPFKIDKPFNGSATVPNWKYEKVKE